MQLEKLRIPWQMGADHLKIDKNNVLNSTLTNIWNCNMHKEVKIDFLNDKVLDAGGLLREWLVLVFKELSHPSLGVFVLAETEDVTYKMNPEIELDEYLTSCFRIAGVATGKAIFER